FSSYSGMMNFLNFVLFSDEATFHSTGQLNRHNCHYWSVANPHWYRRIDFQHQWRLNVWCGIVNGYLIGPYFIEETLNSEVYLHFLRNELPILLENVDLDTRQRLWYQHDGAPPHYAHQVRAYLNHAFSNRWIGRNEPILWPPRSPDLTSPDFFYGASLKIASSLNKTN
ncbi:hypothetical protein X777_14421, partial [Ooceraea biroi]